ncbi:MAG: hypothetical protein CM1200mP14_10040 [Gammaproteobacteria bacterium]|nr:MAG: hypothetical protein CM1200mP14_10040 [Gammaproteobacteria bacterium]
MISTLSKSGYWAWFHGPLQHDWPSNGIGLLVLQFILVPLPGGAQRMLYLPEIEELAQNGRSDEARLLYWAGGKNLGFLHQEKNASSHSGYVVVLQLIHHRL